MDKVKIKNASEDDLTIFYTAYFRTLQYPREFSEYGRYYSAFDDQIHQGVSYNAYSLWDTFRAEHPWLQIVAAERIPAIIEENYKINLDGLSGNDDCGQMPAWYIFSSLGFYPLTPASGEYAIGIPRFDDVSVKLPNGKNLQVVRKDGGTKKTLTDVSFNGKRLNRPFIDIQELWKGGILEFK